MSLPNMLTIDFTAGDICWTDAGLARLECVSLSGSNRRVVYTPARYPFGLALQGGLLFWTDWASNTVERASLRGGQATTLSIPAGGNGKVYDIVNVPKRCPDISNACAVDNGGCRPPTDMCLPTASGRTCVCPSSSNSSDVSADSCPHLTQVA